MICVVKEIGTQINLNLQKDVCNIEQIWWIGAKIVMTEEEKFFAFKTHESVGNEGKERQREF